MTHGLLYLVAILDVASRKVLSFRISNTPDFCFDALTEAIARRARDRQHRSGLPVHQQSVAIEHTPDLNLEYAAMQSELRPQIEKAVLTSVSTQEKA